MLKIINSKYDAKTKQNINTCDQIIKTCVHIKCHKKSKIQDIWGKIFAIYVTGKRLISLIYQ